MPTHDAIEQLAYRLWEERGCPIGTPEVDWLQAEAQLGDDAIAEDTGP